MPHIVMNVGVGICLVIGMVVSQDDVGMVDMDDNMAMKMLKKYNYIGENHPYPEMRNDSMYSEALMMFQMVAGLNQTGQLDQETMKKMQAERCGLPDFDSKADMMKRKKRYMVGDNKWRDGRVGYRYTNYPTASHLTEAGVRTTVDRAFSAWAEVAELDIRPRDPNADIEVIFTAGEHGDQYTLDGPGGTLAHAFPPNAGGAIHFDKDETWAVDGGRGFDLYFVALHEIGHSLGLKHSMEQNAIMHAYYREYDADLRLAQDDINGIQAIYGLKTGQAHGPHEPVGSNPPDGRHRNEFCNAGTVDGIGTLGGIPFVFQGRLYAKLDKGGIMPGYPRPISEDWHGLPDDVDAALGWEQHRILLIFKDTQYWRYYLSEDTVSPTLETGYPRHISDDFKGGLPSTVDSAFLWSKNGILYITKGGEYYRVRKNERVVQGSLTANLLRQESYKYPRNFSEAWNIDQPVSDAFLYNSRTIFFSNTTYSRYNDVRLKFDDNYPMSTSEHWFGCPPPGSLKVPEMEMNMMKRDSQMDEIISSLRDPVNIGHTFSACAYSLVIGLIAGYM